MLFRNSADEHCGLFSHGSLLLLNEKLSPNNSAAEGIMISTKPVSLNAYFSIRDNFDPDSNVTEESDWHL
jgi:hypothetical protein